MCRQVPLYLIVAVRGRGGSAVALLVSALSGGLYAAAAGPGAVSLYRTVA